MKNLRRLHLLLIVILVSCTKSEKHVEHQHESENDDNPNQALYEQVMDIHDEVMPRLEDIYDQKKELKDRLANTLDMEADTKQELELMIIQLDSADHEMMNWMHHFQPLSDSIDEEKARSYLESEMERIKEVKALMLESIYKAKKLAAKQ